MDDLSDAAPFSESVSSDSVVAGFAAAGPMAERLAREHALLLREPEAELKRRARQALDGPAARASEQVQKAAEGVHQKNLWASEEAFRKWKEEFEQAQNAVRDQASAQHNELLGRMRSEFNENLAQTKRLIDEIEKNRTTLRAENDAAAEAVSRVAHARLEVEALEAARIAQLSDEVVARYRERLETTADSWIVSSVRRLNEHGQNAIESLARSSDQALLHSCSRFFDDLAKVFRGRNGEGQS